MNYSLLHLSAMPNVTILQSSQWNLKDFRLTKVWHAVHRLRLFKPVSPPPVIILQLQQS
jgi:hypothetical protein